MEPVRFTMPGDVISRCIYTGLQGGWCDLHQQIRSQDQGIQKEIAGQGRRKTVENLWAVQWHPEFSYQADTNGIRIFRAFAEAM